MLNLSTRMAILFLIVMTASLLGGCNAPSQPTPQIITVVNTVPVEVTRFVEVPQTVEVTRQVIVTQLIEITSTPVPTSELTPTPTSTATQALNPPPPTPTYPEGKVKGISILNIINETDFQLVITIDGPIYATFTLSGHTTVFQRLPEGDYTYLVTKDSKSLYRGTMHITNPDKHILRLTEDKGIFLVP